MEYNNNNLKLIFSDDLKEIIFLGKNNIDLLSSSHLAVFAVSFLDDKGCRTIYTAYDAAIVNASEKNEILFLHYSGFDGAPFDITISIKKSKEPEGFLWSAEINGKDQLEWFEFPCINIENNFKENGGNSKILWPYNEGVIIDSVKDRNTYFPSILPEYPSRGNYGLYPGMLFAPFLALFSDKGNLYIGAKDKEHNTFCVEYVSCGNDVRLVMRAYPGVSGGKYKTNFEIITSLFDGDWYDAAEIYRNQFEEKADQNQYIKISKNKNLPSWYNDFPLVVTYCVRGQHDTDKMDPNNFFPYTNALPVIDEIAKKTGSKIMVILMHWEGTAPWAPPFVMPPFGGEELLREYIKKLHENGHLLGVYCSGLGWTEESRVADYNMENFFNKKELFREMCIAEDSTLPYSNICRAQRSGYDMCPSSTFAHKTLHDEVVKMRSLGIDYIQLLDQNHGGTPYFCYSKEHGHPPVPGNWESFELKKIIKEIREDIKEKDMLLGCETAAAEVFIPEFKLSDNRYELNFLFGVPVPLYSFIYHEYLHNFMGNQVCGEDAMARNIDRFNLLYRIAYSFVAGDFLTLVINDKGRIQWAWGQSDFNESYMPDTEETIGFVSHLCEWYRTPAKSYLSIGRMIRPFDFDHDSKVVLHVAPGAIEVPPVLTACYELPCGSKAQFFVNYTNERVSIKLKNIDTNNLIIHKNPDNYIEKSNGDCLIIEPKKAIMIEKINT